MREKYTLKTSDNRIIEENITSLNQAISLANQTVGVKVYDMDNKVVHVSTKIDGSTIATTNVRVAGQAVRLIRANIYKTAVSPLPFNRLSGMFYLFDSSTNNGRYRVVEDRNKIGGKIKEITGYVNIEDCK